MKSLRMFTILALVALTATGAQAFDLATTAVVEVVEGITVTESTAMDFGSVALYDGNLVLSTNPATAMTDADLISYDPTGYTPGIFSVTSIAGASLNASFVDGDAADGLDVGTFTISQDAGLTDVVSILLITQIAATDTWNIGCTLTVDSAEAALGVAAVGYTMTVVLN